MSPEAKKLVLVSATSTTVIGTREEMVETVKTIETAKAVEIAKAIGTTKISKDGKENKCEYLKNLAQIPYIQYLITFRKKFVPMLALFDLNSKVNAIHLTFARELGLLIRPTDIGVQKIDDTTLDNFEIVVAAFSVTNKANQIRFFEETFLVTNISLKVVF